VFCNTNVEAFLMHIVGIFDVNAMLLHLCVKQFEVELVLERQVSFVPLTINSGAPFDSKLVSVAMEKPSNPATGDLTLCNN
jgi:hypothetical protein